MEGYLCDYNCSLVLPFSQYLYDTQESPVKVVSTNNSGRQRPAPEQRPHPDIHSLSGGHRGSKVSSGKVSEMEFSSWLNSNEKWTRQISDKVAATLH